MAVTSLADTRSSRRWAQMPGNWDRLNCRALFPSGNEWGIPGLPACSLEPARLVSYADRKACEKAEPGSAAHFFLDDYRFEVAWSKPERAISRVSRVGAALTPDFSLWTEMPLCMQQWQVYRSRWCGAWMAHHGITVIPTASWSGPESYAWAFAGISAGSVVAVSAVGTRRDRVASRLFAAGFDAMCSAIRPRLVLAYGPLPDGLPDVPVRTYPSRWER